MLKQIIKYTTPVIILIGTLLIAFGLSNFEGATIIQNRTITYGSFVWNYKYFDFKLYLQNLENSLQINQLEGIIPKQPKNPTQPEAWDLIGWVKFIASFMLQYIMNWLIYGINWLILAPIKLLFYPLNILITLLGINTSNNSYLDIITKVYNFQLPYIPYFA